MADTRRSDAVSAAKSAGFKTGQAKTKNGKNEFFLTNAAGVTVQLGDSEEDVWVKAFNRGILPEAKKQS